MSDAPTKYHTDIFQELATAYNELDDASRAAVTKSCMTIAAAAPDTNLGDMISCALTDQGCQLDSELQGACKGIAKSLTNNKGEDFRKRVISKLGKSDMSVIDFGAHVLAAARDQITAGGDGSGMKSTKDAETGLESSERSNSSRLSGDNVPRPHHSSLTVSSWHSNPPNTPTTDSSLDKNRGMRALSDYFDTAPQSVDRVATLNPVTALCAYDSDQREQIITSWREIYEIAGDYKMEDILSFVAGDKNCDDEGIQSLCHSLASALEQTPEMCSHVDWFKKDLKDCEVTMRDYTTELLHSLDEYDPEMSRLIGCDEVSSLEPLHSQAPTENLRRRRNSEKPPNTSERASPAPTSSDSISPSPAPVGRFPYYSASLLSIPGLVASCGSHVSSFADGPSALYLTT